MVIPASATYNAPQPDQFFLGTVCDHLLPRRLITTELHVRGPDYVDVWVSVGITALSGYAFSTVREAVRQALQRFLSPLYGGYNGEGWPLNIPVLSQELEAVVARIDGVQLVHALLLGSVAENTVPSIPMTGLALPRLVGLSVTDNAPISLEQLKKAPEVTANLPEGHRWMPIPILPERC